MALRLSGRFSMRNVAPPSRSIFTSASVGTSDMLLSRDHSVGCTAVCRRTTRGTKPPGQPGPGGAISPEVVSLYDTPFRHPNAPAALQRTQGWQPPHVVRSNAVKSYGAKSHVRTSSARDQSHAARAKADAERTRGRYVGARRPPADARPATFYGIFERSAVRDHLGTRPRNPALLHAVGAVAAQPRHCNEDRTRESDGIPAGLHLIAARISRRRSRRERLSARPGNFVDGIPDPCRVCAAPDRPTCHARARRPDQGIGVDGCARPPQHRVRGEQPRLGSHRPAARRGIVPSDRVHVTGAPPPGFAARRPDRLDQRNQGRDAGPLEAIRRQRVARAFRTTRNAASASIAAS